MSTTICKNNDSKTKENEIREYWTQERMDKASPKVMPEVPDTPGDIELPPPKGPIATPPDTSLTDSIPDIELKVGLATKVTNPDKSPLKCNGKLYFTWKGEDWVGSAGAILLEVLLTAGHNVFDEGEWSDNFYFYPAYPVNGQSWGWSRAAIFTAWQNAADYAYDYAMLLTDSPMKDIGSVGVVRDLNPKGREWTAIGYPSEPPYDGGNMMETTGNYVKGSTIITMDKNDMTQGSSGGVWLTKTDKGTFVNGVQSHRKQGESSYAASPYIADKDYQELKDCLKEGCD